MGIRETRRREQAELLRQSAQGGRPATPRDPVPAAEQCPSRVGARCDFGAINHDDPRGSGLVSVRCWYCTRYSPTSQARADAWRRATQEHPDGR